MSEILFLSCIIVVACAFPAYWVLVGINHLILLWKYKKTPECECPVPKRADYGDLFVCPECAWVLQYDYDDFSSGWCWMTWQVHLRYRLGWYPTEKMREPDPLPTVGRSVESKMQKNARLLARRLRQLGR